MAPIDLPAGLTLRPMKADDCAAGERLSSEAGWNQNGHDWTYILNAGLCWGCESTKGELVASAALLPYDDEVAWVCMVLVTASWRKKGIATALLNHAIAEANARGWRAGLDATEAGRPIYLPLGFEDCFSLTRYAAEGPVISAPETHQSLRPLTGTDLSQVVRLDTLSAGVDRTDLIKSLLERSPELAWGLEETGTLSGFCLGRDGRDADQIGPVVAADGSSAIRLTEAALNNRLDPARRVYIDAKDDNSVYCNWLAAQGFKPQRGFMRMLHGSSTPPGDPRLIAAIAGPELS